MNDLDTLRPEVADAVSALDETTCMTNPGLKWYATIRAELLRLAEENSQLRDVLADRDMDREMAAHANKELAALKARIAESAHLEVTLGCAIDGEIPPDLALCKVALVKMENDDV